ncbi:MAG: serine--tRNA ligase [Chloroflexi bacterium]|nr:serine--tRNA ligase [Chloroflexota bacterium]
MLDINLIREKPDWVKEQLGKLFDEGAVARIDRIVALDARRRELLQDAENRKGSRNKLSKQVGRLRGDKNTPEGELYAVAEAVMEKVAARDLDGAMTVFEEFSKGERSRIVSSIKVPVVSQGKNEKRFNEKLNDLFAAMKEISDEISELDEEIREIEEELDENMLWLPNIPHESVPVFPHEEDNIPHPEKGTRRSFDFTPKPHWELGPELGIIDFERGVKLSGTRFYILAGMGARLQRALYNFLLDELNKAGFTELYVPLLIQEHAMYGSGQFPKFIDTSYRVEDGTFYLLPTSEVAIVNMYAGEIFEQADLPLNHTAETSCFRQEKMSAGRDVRGIKRVHQFEKVEMVVIAEPDKSYDALEWMTETSEGLVDKLGLPYRRLEIVSGDLGFTATKKYDIETWAPGCEEWLEISSCSNTEAFQARRASIKFRPEEGGKPQFVHMLNGSALGIPRTIIAILENYQTADGSVIIPDVLRPYLGGQQIIEPK